MDKNKTYFLVDKEVLPKIYEKVVEVKKIMNEGNITSVNDVVKKVGLSRSTYYKYKDHVFPFYETTKGMIITLLVTVEDIKGVLSNILRQIANAKGNVLTIDQNMPRNGMADIIISLETEDMNIGIKELIDTISEIEGVHNQDILSRE